MIKTQPIWSTDTELCICGHTREEHKPAPSLECEQEDCLCACFEPEEEDE